MSARKTVAGLFGLALIIVGVSFLAIGLASALAPFLGLAGGAAVTGVLLLLPPLIWALTTGSAAEADEMQPAAGYETVWAAELSRLANKKPLLAVFVALVAGAASSLLRR